MSRGTHKQCHWSRSLKYFWQNYNQEQPLQETLIMHVRHDLATPLLALGHIFLEIPMQKGGAMKTTIWGI